MCECVCVLVYRYHQLVQLEHKENCMKMMMQHEDAWCYQWDNEPTFSWAKGDDWPGLVTATDGNAMMARKVQVVTLTMAANFSLVYHSCKQASAHINKIAIESSTLFSTRRRRRTRTHKRALLGVGESKFVVDFVYHFIFRLYSFVV